MAKDKYLNKVGLKQVIDTIEGQINDLHTEIDNMVVGQVECDTELSIESDKPVANKAITKVINEIVDGTTKVGNASIADEATKASFDGDGNKISETYAKSSDVSSSVANLQSQIDTKVPNTRKVNGKALSADISLTASDVGADESGAAAQALTDAKEYNDAAYANANAYTDQKIADLINSAPTTLDTLGEIATAMQENADVVEALEESIGNKANASDLTSHTSNTTVHITSTERTNWNDANSKKHSHSNKTVLDNTTASYTTALNTKLSGIATGAEVNQNAFSNVTVGSTTISADSKTDTLTLVAGSNVTITPDATNDKITIAATDTVYTHPSYTARTGVPTSNQTPAFGGTFTVSQPISDATGHIAAMNSRTITIPSAVATTSTSGLMSANDKTEHDNLHARIAGYAVTAGTTSAFTATVDGATLTQGTMIALRFNAANAASATLNVNSLGAKPIYYCGAAIKASRYAANSVAILVYDNTQVTTGAWHCVYSYDSNTTYTNVKLGHGYGTCTTAEATVAKVVTLSSYTLATGGIVAVKFTYAVPASATMNINSRGAKNIYYRGSALTSGVIKAGDIGVFMYDGTQYHLLTVDRNTETYVALTNAEIDAILAQ